MGREGRKMMRCIKNCRAPEYSTAPNGGGLSPGRIGCGVRVRSGIRLKIYSSLRVALGSKPLVAELQVG